MGARHEEFVKFVNKVFDQAKEQLNISSDSELARRLYENQGNISKFRKGERMISDWKLLNACKFAGIPKREALEKILFYKSLKAEVEEVLKDFLDIFIKNDLS